MDFSTADEKPFSSACKIACVRASVYSLIFRERGLRQFVETVSSIGYKVVEVRVHEDGVHLHPFASVDEARELKRQLDNYGLSVCCLASYAKLGYTSGAEVKKALSVARLADELEAPLFRIKVASYNPHVGYEGVRAAFRKQLSELLEALKSEGVSAVPVVEQHGGDDMAHSTCMLKDLLRGIDPERVGVIFDPGNSVREGWLPLPLQLDVIREYIKHVHVKNYEWIPDQPGAVRPSPLHRGIVDWRFIVETLRSWGYGGCLSLEDFRPMPPEERAREALEFFRQMGIE